KKPSMPSRMPREPAKWATVRFSCWIFYRHYGSVRAKRTGTHYRLSCSAVVGSLFRKLEDRDEDGCRCNSTDRYCCFARLCHAESRRQGAGFLGTGFPRRQGIQLLACGRAEKGAGGSLF